MPQTLPYPPAATRGPWRMRRCPLCPVPALALPGTLASTAMRAQTVGALLLKGGPSLTLVQTATASTGRSGGKRARGRGVDPAFI